MKAKLFLIICVLVSASCFGQTEFTGDTYLTDTVYKSDNGNYIAASTTENHTLKKTIRYAFQNKKLTAFIIYPDSIIEQKHVESPDIFSYIDENMKSLKKLNRHMLKNRNEFTPLFSTTENYIGIKYKNIFNGHFPVLKQEALNGLNLYEYSKAFLVIEKIYKLLNAIAVDKGNNFIVPKSNK